MADIASLIKKTLIKLKLDEETVEKYTSETAITIIFNSMIFITCSLALILMLFVLSLPICSIESINEFQETGKNEKWIYGNCVYYCFVTISTVGKRIFLIFRLW